MVNNLTNKLWWSTISSINCDGQQSHQYQQNKQSPLTLYFDISHWFLYNVKSATFGYIYICEENNNLQISFLNCLYLICFPMILCASVEGIRFTTVNQSTGLCSLPEMRCYLLLCISKMANNPTNINKTNNHLSPCVLIFHIDYYITWRQNNKFTNNKII